ncbi:ATP-binding protein [Robertmurraya massiliosenegalensis]|uniref:ATP-binding protein n=1 Tax=Robertmurraya massiliosenegalensis TaxID=1287657 RepID=UPI0002DFC781|nr:AAA family ATPase [Robertmurraya massiliosenegalensis]
MKIKELHIYGYGKLENTSVVDLQDLTVFYGENEAGKSTIMSFVHSVLFGFPTKQQNELRYEPKKGSKYGGQLVLELEEGNVTIERVKGKAIGDVTVVLADGTTGGEEKLKELLSQMDKGLYQSIFSFNIHGLQNIHQLKGEDLGRFLFSTGTVGTERLLTAEAELLKEVERRFKPNGKKPSINEKVKEIKEVHQELKRAEQENGQYGELLKQREQLEESIQANQKEMYKLQKKMQELEEWEKLLPIVKERELLQRQLEEFDGGSFPTDGLSRLNQVQQLLIPLEGQMKSLRDRKMKVEEELLLHEPNRQLLENEVEIQKVLEQMTLYHQMKEEMEQWQGKRTQTTEKIEELESMLHLSLDEEQLSQVNTSIFMKEKTASAEKKQGRLQERKQELDEQFLKEQEEMERLEHQIGQLQEELLPEGIREENEQKVQRWKRKDVLERELHSIGDKIHLLNLNVKKEKEQLQYNRLQFLFLGSLFVMLMIWGLLQDQWGLTIIGAVGVCFSAYMLFFRKKNDPKEMDVELHSLKEEEAILQNELSGYSSAEITLVTEQLKRDQALRDQLTIMQIKWEQQNAQYEKVLQAYENWEQEVKEHGRLLRQLGKELFLPEDLALNHVHEAFLLISKVKELKREERDILTQFVNKETSVKSFEESLEKLTKLFLSDMACSTDEQAFLLKEKLRKEMVKKQKHEAMKEKLQELIEQLENVKREYDHLNMEKVALFEVAQVTSEEEYRLKGKDVEKSQQIALKIEELLRHLQLSSLKIEEMKLIEPALEREETISRVQHLEEENQGLQQSLAEVKHQISLLEDGGVYGELLHKYKQLQSALDEEAKGWAKFIVAKEMLQKTVNRFKEERLPTMLKKAEQYLSFLTEENYLRILPKPEGNGFLIERKDHILFEANELSQATTEQVYVSLRLALATTIYEKYPFPIMIDDSFVNFDHVRTSKIIELVKGMRNNQILFFTCHQHLLNYFHEKEILKMDKLVSDTRTISIQ